MSSTSKTRSNLAKANEIASGGGNGTLDRDENLRYVWDGVWEGQEPGGRWGRRVWDKRRGAGRVLLGRREKVWQKLRGHENGASPEGNGEAPGKKCSVFILRRCPWLRLR